MPRGKKTCPECKTECGPRSFKCPKCDHPFIATTAQTAMPVKATKNKTTQSEERAKRRRRKSDLPPNEPKVVHQKGLVNISTPAGHCPVKPKELTFDGIKEWAQRVREYGLRFGDFYTARAIAYWLRREFVDAVDHPKLFAELKPACFESNRYPR